MSMTTPIYQMTDRFRKSYIRLQKNLPEWMWIAMKEEFTRCRYFGIAGCIVD